MPRILAKNGTTFGRVRLVKTGAQIFQTGGLDTSAAPPSSTLSPSLAILGFQVVLGA
jgi:hypothetical protein